MEPNPYEPPQSPSPPVGSRGSIWKWICLVGFSLTLLGFIALPGPIGPSEVPYLLGCLGCIAIGLAFLLLGAVGWFVHWLRSTGGWRNETKPAKLEGLGGKAILRLTILMAIGAMAGAFVLAPLTWPNRVDFPLRCLGAAGGIMFALFPGTLLLWVTEMAMERICRRD